MTVKEVRKASGFSMNRAAALAGVSPPTWRAFELSPEGVSEAKRDKCQAATEALARLAGLKP